MVVGHLATLSAALREVWRPRVRLAPVALVVFIVVALDSSTAAARPGPLAGTRSTFDFPNARIAEVALRYEHKWGGEACRDAGRSGLRGGGPFPVEPVRAANGKVTRAGDGQCRAFVNCVVKIASGSHNVWLGGGAGRYFTRFATLKVQEIETLDALRKGDIVQVGATEDAKPLHTYVVLGRVSGNVFDIVDSNGDTKETVIRRKRPVTLNGTSTRAFRVGTIGGLNPPVPPRPTPPRPPAPTFTGTGNKSVYLAPFWAGTLRYTHTGNDLRIVLRGYNNVEITSTEHSGWSWILGRTWLDVHANGRWSISFSYEIEKPRRLSGGLVGYSGNGSIWVPGFTTTGEDLHWWLHKGTEFGLVLHDRAGYSGGAKAGGRRSGIGYVNRGYNSGWLYADGSRWTFGWKP